MLRAPVRAARRRLPLADGLSSRLAELVCHREEIGGDDARAIRRAQRGDELRRGVAEGRTKLRPRVEETVDALAGRSVGGRCRLRAEAWVADAGVVEDRTRRAQVLLDGESPGLSRPEVRGEVGGGAAEDEVDEVGFEETRRGSLVGQGGARPRRDVARDVEELVDAVDDREAIPERGLKPPCVGLASRA